MNGINKESQVSLIDFSESINVIKGGEGGFWHSCGVDYYLHLFQVKGPENRFSQTASYYE